MAERPDQTAATPPESTPDSGHPDARLEALATAPDPMLEAFAERADSARSVGGAPPSPPQTTDEQSPADDATHSEAEAKEPPAPRQRPEPSKPPADSIPDIDGGNPDELRQWVRQHPALAKALGLEVREQLQKHQSRLHQEQQARQAAEEQAAASQAEQQKVGQYYDAFYDEDSPIHWEAVQYFAKQGVQPVEVTKVLNSPLVRQHVDAYAQQVAQWATEQATEQAIKAAADHPLLKSLGGDALEEAWQESDGSVPGFYTEALRRRGWFPPDEAAEFRAAAEEDARTKAFGNYPPADGSVVHAGTSPTTTRPIPASPSDIDPTEWFQSGFARTNGRQNGSD